jgi:hypothetical protein
MLATEPFFTTLLMKLRDGHTQLVASHNLTASIEHHEPRFLTSTATTAIEMRSPSILDYIHTAFAG